MLPFFLPLPLPFALPAPSTLQLCIFEKFGAAANDLADGDSGVDKESDGRRRRRKVDGAGKAKGKGKGRKLSLIHI